MTNTLFIICPPLLLVTPISLFALPPAGGLRHAVLLNAVLITGALKMQDRKMTDKDIAGGGKCRTGI